MRLPGRLLVVTDRHQAATPLPQLCEMLFSAGLRWVWLRDRDLAPAERRALALDLAARAARYGAALTVGADVALAAAVGAGVQLGAGADVVAARRALAPGAPVGVSAHSLDEIRAARDAGADYATLSPVFPSRSKPGYGPALGLAGLGAASRLGLPVLALGGVTAALAPDCLAAGAAGVAIMGEAMRGGFAPQNAERSRGGFAPQNAERSRGGFAPQDAERSRGGFAPQDVEEPRGGLQPAMERA